jgi:thiosulfate/3-mercaptopyruvate sulfurtransferase
MVARATAVQPARSGVADVLVEPQWLEAHLHNPLVRVVEVDVSSAAYDDGHIDGAVLWNIYRDLKDSEYRLVEKSAVERLLARSGITPESTVVFYGYGPAIGFWLMKLYGHADARILNCARGTWRDEGRAWTAEVATLTPTTYELPEEDTRIRARGSDVERAIVDPASIIVDVRSEAEFQGERFWPSGGMEEGGRAGHIPSAVHAPIDDLYDERGVFRDPRDLSQMFSPLRSSGTSEIITYCTIGGRACTAWFALTYLLGREHIRVYDGSWAEWGRTPTTPIIRS